MIRYFAMSAWRFGRNVPGVGMLFLLLAALLAACATPHEPGPVLFPKDKLSVLHVPASYTLPGQIVRGPDGNLWFPAIGYVNFATDKPGGAIGRLTPAGQFQMFPLPDPNSYPTSIAFGSDGTIWLIVFQGNGQLAPIGDTAPRFTGGFSELGRMASNGQFHLFSLPSSDVDVTSIAAGSDGNLWFTENVDENGQSSLGIGRMTPARVFTNFPVTAPFADGYLHQIIAGPDGNLWFATANVEVGRVSTAGAFAFYALPYSADFDNGSSSLTLGDLKGIVTGAGALWLTDVGQIGQFV
jgi:streptogramin lyase